LPCSAIPFGLPIPHTAIVPRNKERIGDAIGRFISNNFLSPSVLAAKIREIDTAGWLSAWLSNPANPNRIARQVATSLPAIIQALPRDELNAFVAGAYAGASKWFRRRRWPLACSRCCGRKARCRG